MAVLPPELYRPIISNVHTKEDLYNLLFVSHIFLYEAERILYHAIRVNSDSRNMPLSMALLQHLASCQRVARHVQELGISGGIPFFAMYEDETSTLDPYWYSLNQALCAMINLRVLILSLHSTAPRITCFVLPPSSIFTNCTFRLEVIRFSNPMFRKVPDDELDLVQVKELDLNSALFSDKAIDGIPTGTLHTLQIFSSTRSQSFELGTGNTNRIKALELLYTPGLTFADPTYVKLYFKPHSDFHYFPSLRHLYVMSTIDMMEVPDSSLLVDESSVRNDLKEICWDNLRSVISPIGLHRKLVPTINSLKNSDIVDGLQIERWNWTGRLVPRENK